MAKDNIPTKIFLAEVSSKSYEVTSNFLSFKMIITDPVKHIIIPMAYIVWNFSFKKKIEKIMVIRGFTPLNIWQVDSLKIDKDFIQVYMQT
jgi:hypothetical protein